jgi:hypothetical protein
MPTFRRGVAAIQEAAEGKPQNKYRSFAPSISWSKDDPDKYVLILTPITEVVAAELHSWIPVGEVDKQGGGTRLRYEDFISRKDSSIGESYDLLEDEFGRKAFTKIMGVGVELEPTFEVVRGRKKPNGFTATTRSYTRRTDEGEEKVVVPNIGIITNTSRLLWSPLSALDQTQGPLEVLPLQITREGIAQQTSYNVIPFQDVPVDLDPVVASFEGISYISDAFDEIKAELDALDEDDEFSLNASQVVARHILDARLNELTDATRYEELTRNIRYLPEPFTNKRPKFGPPGTAGSESTVAPPEVTESVKTKTKKVEPVVEAAEESEEVLTGEIVEEEPSSKQEKFAALRAKLEEKNG